MVEFKNESDKGLYEDLKRFIDLGTEIITRPEGIELSLVEEHSYNYLNVIVERSLTIYKILTDKDNIDIFSAEILFRSLMETYIKFYDLFFNSGTAERLALRILREKAISAWEDLDMFGMVGDDNPDGRELLSRIYKERKDDILKSKIYTSVADKDKMYYSDIENWYKKKYNKIDITELAQKAGINANNTNLFYKYTSNFTHGDPTTIVQAGIFIENTKPEFFNSPVLMQTIAVLSKSIVLYIKLNPSENILETDKEIQQQYWEILNKNIKEQ